MVVYIFCVCIPMIVTNGVTILSIRDRFLQRQEIMINNTIDRIKYNIKAEVDGCISIASDLYTDKVINKFLTRDYKSNIDYHDYYIQFIQQNVLRYYYNSQKINNIMLYTDNETLINGGSFWRIQDIKNEKWYKSFEESGQDSLLLTYYDETKKYTALGMCRIISFIKKLNYADTKVGEKFVKIDLQYNAILNDLLNEQMEGEVYICNESKILFSNTMSESSSKPFESKDKLKYKEATYKDTFPIGTEMWEIYIIPDEITIWSMFHASKNVIIFLVIINLLLPTCIISIIARSFTERIKLIESYLDKVKREQFEVIRIDGGADEIGTLIKTYNLMVIKIKELIEVVLKKNAEKQILEIAKKEAELKALQSQVNPHFMFNTLESIRMRSLLKQELETADIIGELSLILRRSFSWKDDFISIKEEMAFVTQYANIQKYRFGEKLEFGFYIMPECEELQIPKLSILTFVENACIHGIEEIAGRGQVFVTVTRDEQSLYIEISDSGGGISELHLEKIRERLKAPHMNQLGESRSTGMLNALIRMNLYCGGKVRFQIDSQLDQGTDIMIQIPLE